MTFTNALNKFTDTLLFVFVVLESNVMSPGLLLGRFLGGEQNILSCKFLLSSEKIQGR